MGIQISGVETVPVDASGALLVANDLSDVSDKSAAVDNLGGAASTGTGGLVRIDGATLTGTTNVANLTASGTVEAAAFTVGGVASSGSGGLVRTSRLPIYAQTGTSDVTVSNNSTTLTDVTGLSISLASGVSYEIEACINYGSGSNTAGNKFRFTYSGSAVGGIEFVEYHNNLGTATDMPIGFFGATYTAAGTQEANAVLMMRVLITTSSSGTLKFQSAQQTAEAFNHILRYSYIKATITA